MTIAGSRVTLRRALPPDRMRAYEWLIGSDLAPGMMGGAMMSRDQMRQMMGANADFDRMFLQMMIPHHEAAIAMAEQALTQAEHREIKTLAQGIITTQRAEIGEMQRYLQ